MQPNDGSCLQGCAHETAESSVMTAFVSESRLLAREAHQHQSTINPCANELFSGPACLSHIR